MPDLEKEIAKRVDAFVADLSELLRKAALQQAAEILAEQARAPAGRTPGRSAKRAAETARTGRRSPAQIDRMTKQLMSAIVEQPGSRIEEIAKTLAVSTKDLVIPVRRLLDDKQVVRKGARRATRYFPRGSRAK